MAAAQTHIQSVFLEEVKKRIHPSISFADDLSEILQISKDSAYRRIRGETILSLDEVKTICNHYGVSLDSLMAPTSNTVTFHHRMVGFGNFGFDAWLKSILDNLVMINGFPEKEIIYSAKDIPPFHHFKYPDLTAFKIFFWNKTILGTRFVNDKFQPALVSNELMAMAEKIWEKYSMLPSTEIWSEETIHITLRQIEFYFDCGFFKEPDQVSILLSQFSDMLSVIRNWAATGIKNEMGGKFSLYKNDILIADNTVFFKMGDKRVVHNTHNTMELLTTSQEHFCKQTEKYLMNLLNKAVLISTTGEKERNKFFNAMDTKVEALKRKLT